MQMNRNEIFPGVLKLSFGEAESATPVKLRNIASDVAHVESLPVNQVMPFNNEDILFKQTARGCVIELPLSEKEDIYGLGLQLKSFRQTGKKKTLRVNSDPVADTGDSHAPVPFYLSTSGYGVLVDTARYATFYCGSHQALKKKRIIEGNSQKQNIGTTTDELYSTSNSTNTVIVDVPVAKGVDIYIFTGPSMRDALRRYIMFSGGGCLPPLWGLGIVYRGYAKNTQEDTLKLARQLRENNMPCNVFGLEPGWMNKSYSCNYIWNKDNFPDVYSFLKEMKTMGYEINLWEQLFVHPTAPFYEEMKAYSGDYTVWDGLVPDFSIKDAGDIFGKYHRKNFIDHGINGFKVDECDNSDFIRFPWSFPEMSEFPSGMDGEQMHSCLGRLGQHTLLNEFQAVDKRTYSNCRSSHAMASPYPFVIYSDLYEHQDFIRGTVNAGLSGLLWTPEVRQCESVEDLIRRIQSVIFSPMALINAWMIKNPPWLQYDIIKNNQDISMDNHKDIEDICRELFQLRMRLIPYLYSAFAQYRFFGIPPFRALVVDWPEDPAVRDIDDQYMVGESIMIAPLIAGSNRREVYLPEGEWIDFFSNKLYSGGKSYEVTADLKTIPLFVKNNTLLPLAEPVEYVQKDTVFNICVRIYGDNPHPFKLFYDDGYSFAYEEGDYRWLELNWSPAKGRNAAKTEKYKILDWEKIY
jgi:alpha-D-xyloside xylohydrolase